MKKIFAVVALGVLFAQAVSFACGMKDHAEGAKEGVETTEKA